MTNPPQIRRDPASYRDPSGFVFYQGEKVFRQINRQGKGDFQFFLNTGLADRLKSEKLLVDFNITEKSSDSFVIEVKKIPFITYPYEWSFSQLREAALTTLKINRVALDYGMILKDASAFNVVFSQGKALFLDHTSFSACPQNGMWKAYKQFCTNFLAPLYLMKYSDMRCLDLFKSDINGIQLDFASRLLPWYTYFIPAVLMHIHLHAKFDSHYSADKNFSGTSEMPLKRLNNFIDELTHQISSLEFPSKDTLWGKYYQKTNYVGESFKYKQQTVRDFCSIYGTGTVLDLGANTGVFSEIAAEYADKVIAVDADLTAVEHLYQLSRKRFSNIYPARLDLFNPTAALGLFNQERSSFFSRSKCDCILGLALIHHLRVSGNWQTADIVKLFSVTGKYALVEFVPLEDEQMQQLVRGRENIYDDWNIDNVLEHFRKEFPFVSTSVLPDSKRIMIKLAKEKCQL